MIKPTLYHWFWPGDESVKVSRNFTAGEFKKPRWKGPWPVSDELVTKLQVLRSALDIPIRINSGYRDYFHNKNIGGAKYSKHMVGCAVDIHVHPTLTPWELARALYQSGFRRIGIAKNFVHGDTADGNAYWIYSGVPALRGIAIRRQRTKSLSAEEIGYIESGNPFPKGD